MRFLKLRDKFLVKMKKFYLIFINFLHKLPNKMPSEIHSSFLVFILKKFSNFANVFDVSCINPVSKIDLDFVALQVLVYSEKFEFIRKTEI